MSTKVLAHLTCDICGCLEVGADHESVHAARTRLGWHYPQAPSGARRDVCPPCWLKRFAPHQAHSHPLAN